MKHVHGVLVMLKFFDADNSSSSHNDPKNIFLVLGEGMVGVNGSVGAPKKRLV